MTESERERGRIMTLWQGPPEKGKTLAAAGDKFAFSLGSQYKVCINMFMQGESGMGLKTACRGYLLRILFLFLWFEKDMGESRTESYNSYKAKLTGKGNP